MALSMPPDETISSIAFLKQTTCSRIPFGFEDRFEIRNICSRSIIPSAKIDIQITSPIPNTSRGKKETDGSQVIQKKIIPWEKLIQMDLDVSTDRSRPQSQRSTLIIVATLISKIPNLGGLCRTCETFNAELLVVNNLDIKKDASFLATCVTAEKWQPMEQVREPELEAFLLLLKSRGYSLIGIEQATNSISLEQAQFPIKSCVVLGKEKQGIPPELLPLMDYIVEIPQFGLIRSLNVHVSGSLVIWEYARQHLTKSL